MLILLPNFFKNKIRSIISGSIAQFSNSVLPSAPEAASKAFYVAPTEIEGNFIFVPLSPFFASATI